MTIPVINAVINFSTGPSFAQAMILDSGILGTNVLADAASVIVDVSNVVDSIETKRGRNPQADQFQTGTLTMRIVDQNGDFNPQNPASPYYNLLTPMRKVQITATYGAVTYPIMSAFITSYTTSTPKNATDVVYTTITAVDAFSVVLNQLRERALDNPPKTFGYYEYSAPQYCKIDDPNAWALANPALGFLVTKETLSESVATSPIENTRTELLCQWIDSLSSPWPHGILEDTSDASLTIPPGGYTVFGFDVSPSRRNASLVAGQLLPDGRIGVGILQTWESAVSVDDLKIAADIKGWADNYRPRQICYDKYTAQSIADKLTNAGCMTQDISGASFYQACGDLLDGLVNLRVIHSGQANWIQQMNNCAAKVNDSAWRIVKRKSAGDVSGAIATAMVVHMLYKPQQVAAIYTE
jgi:hypothetical protein